MSAKLIVLPNWRFTVAKRRLVKSMLIKDPQRAADALLERGRHFNGMQRCVVARRSITTAIPPEGWASGARGIVLDWSPREPTPCHWESERAVDRRAALAEKVEAREARLERLRERARVARRSLLDTEVRIQPVEACGWASASEGEGITIDGMGDRERLSAAELADRAWDSATFAQRAAEERAEEYERAARERFAVLEAARGGSIRW